jgi:hypothetical protein
VTVHPANLKAMFSLRSQKLGAETAVALAGTAFSAILLVLTAIYVGPLWRDETNALNVAQMPSLKEFWNNLTFESYPPLWPLLLRGWSFLGLAGSDAGIRVLGLCVGLFFLVSLWLCSRWIGSRAPILSVALLGSLPAFIFTMGSNRAYGLANCLLVLSFGMIWRMVEIPSRSRILGAGLVCLLFAHCVYYDAVFLGAMFSGAAVVVIRRRQWKTLGALAGIGAVFSASMLIYLPIIHRNSVCWPVIQEPGFSLLSLWHKLDEAVTAQSSAAPAGSSGPDVWLWIVILLVGTVVALLMPTPRGRRAQNQEATAAITAGVRADLALFCVVSIFLGITGYLAFLLKIGYPTNKWYYVEILSLCAISLDGILGANWPRLRPWGLLRIGFMVAMMTWDARSGWAEAHTRRSNVDLIANVLGKNASAGDLIVIHTAWEGITFNRYYRGQARWVTVPPIDSHEAHRNDLIMEKLKEPDTMAPVLREITSTLRNGNRVWLVGHVTVVHARPLPPPPRPPAKWWRGFYFEYWSIQVTSLLLDHALEEKVIEIRVDGPVSSLEDLPVVQFWGYRSDAN